jgi:hypothetical protein
MFEQYREYWRRIENPTKREKKTDKKKRKKEKESKKIFDENWAIKCAIDNNEGKYENYLERLKAKKR